MCPMGRKVWSSKESGGNATRDLQKLAPIKKKKNT